MIAIVAVIAAATAAGFGAQQRFGERADGAARRIVWLLLWVLMPPIVFLNIAALELEPELLGGVAFAYAGLLVTLVLAYLVGTRVLALARPAIGALMLAAGFANTGYLGLPFSAALFGLDELPNAVLYDSLVSTLALVTIGFSIGAAFGTAAERPRDQVAAFFARNPPLWACVAGFVAPAALAPDWAVEASQVLVLGILPLAFFSVGVTLAAEGQEGARWPSTLTAPIGTAVALKLVIGPAVVLALSSVVLEVPEPFVSQAAMASAVNCIVVAQEYGLDRSLVAGAIAWSTAIVAVAGLIVALV